MGVTHLGYGLPTAIILAQHLPEALVTMVSPAVEWLRHCLSDLMVSDTFWAVLQLQRQLEFALSQSLLSGISLQPIRSSSSAAMAFLSSCPVRQLWTW